MSIPIAPTPAAIPQPQQTRLQDVLGPGLITGASDDDPSGIATYSQAGAQFGYSLGWTLLLTYPLMCAIQLISAQIGRVTGRGLAGNIRRHYPAWLLYPLVGLLVVANTINLGADLGAMAAALHLLIDGPTLAYIAGFALLTVLAEVFITYARYASVLKWLTVSLFAYVGAVFVVGVPWLTVAKNLVVDTYRARRARPTETGDAAIALLPAEDEAERALESWAVADALSTLRPEHRQVLLETYYRGHSVAEAASVLGIPSGTVKSRTFYALRALKLALEERGLAP